MRILLLLFICTVFVPCSLSLPRPSNQKTSVQSVDDDVVKAQIVEFANFISTQVEELLERIKESDFDGLGYIIDPKKDLKEVLNTSPTRLFISRRVAKYFGHFSQSKNLEIIKARRFFSICLGIVLTHYVFKEIDPHFSLSLFPKFLYYSIVAPASILTLNAGMKYTEKLMSWFEINRKAYFNKVNFLDLILKDESSLMLFFAHLDLKSGFVSWNTQLPWLKYFLERPEAALLTPSKGASLSAAVYELRDFAKKHLPGVMKIDGVDLYAPNLKDLNSSKRKATFKYFLKLRESVIKAYLQKNKKEKALVDLKQDCFNAFHMSFSSGWPAYKFKNP